MNNARFVVPFALLTTSLIFLGGCRFNEGGGTEPASVEETDQLETDPLANAAPSIWGQPLPATMVGEMYVFQPEAFDDDGDVLEFSIANLPDWAQFDHATGRLQGVPGDEDVGEAGNIVISVTDQTSVASLPSFGVTVRRMIVPADDDAGPVHSSPPVITGKPNTSVVVDSMYSFQPEASDADGDELSFSIVNKPRWAKFDTTTGRLRGRPHAEDVGVTRGIEFSVSDGNSVSALAKFRITVEQAGAQSFTLSWNPPTQNEDGSPLTDLAGYRIYYGTTSGEYDEEIAVDSAGQTSYVIDNLAPGRYFLVMTSVNSRGMESKYTPELTFDLD